MLRYKIIFFIENFTKKQMDTSWIDEYIEHEDKYGKFYKEENETCNMQFIYLNDENEIMFVCKDKVILEDNTLKSSVLMPMIERRREKYNERYKIHDIFFYNITTDSEELVRFKERVLYKNYLKTTEIMEDIVVEPSISMFKDLNEIIIIFKKKSCMYSSRHNKTRKSRKQKNEKRRNKSEKF